MSDPRLRCESETYEANEGAFVVKLRFKKKTNPGTRMKKRKLRENSTTATLATLSFSSYSTCSTLH